ncbi:hypothetical protein BGX24_000478, partial [Mortierella sp. AD032]
MVTPSVLGKTATVFDLASQHSVICCVCGYPCAINDVDIYDRHFIALAEEAEMMYNTTAYFAQTGIKCNVEDIDFD